MDVEKDAMFQSSEQRSLCGALPEFVARWQHMIGDVTARAVFAAAGARNSKPRLKQLSILMHAGSEEDIG